MRYDILYAVASDLIDKRDVNTNTNDTYICVCVTNANMYTGCTRFDIVGTKLDVKYAEEEAINNAFNAGYKKIEAMIIMNCKTRQLSTPCERCIQMLLTSHFENKEMLIIQNNMQYIKLEDLMVTSNKIDTSDDFNMMIDDFDMSKFNPNLSSNGESKISKDLADVDDPLSYSNNLFNKESNYQNKSRYLVQSQSIHSQYIPSVSVPISSQYTPRAQFSDDNARFKERLNGILNIEEEEIDESQPQSIKPKFFNRFKKSESNEIDTNEDAEPSKLTRKELMKLAKEKKRSAKKDMKIREEIESKN
jgi:cytidine deaminase